MSTLVEDWLSEVENQPDPIKRLRIKRALRRHPTTAVGLPVPSRPIELDPFDALELDDEELEELFRDLESGNG